MRSELNNEVVQSMLHSNRENMLPIDKYHLARILFYTLGTLTQISHNFFVNANDYWMYKFRDTSVPYNYSDKSNRTTLQTNFTSHYNIVSQVTSIVFLIITILLAKWAISMKVRIYTSLVGMVGIFFITLSFIVVDTDTWQRGFYVITLIIGSLLSGFATVFAVSCFQLVSKFPPEYLSSQLSGQAICGIVSSLVQIFALAIGASTKGTAFIYFSIGAICILVTLIYFIYMNMNSEYFIYNMDREIKSSDIKITRNDVKRVASNIKYLLITMCCTLGVTVMLNPGLTSLIVSVSPGHRWNDVFFVPVCTYLFFNLFDFIGREAAPIFKYPKNGIVLTILSLLRFAFVPLILYCNLQPRSHTSVAFNSDAAYIILMILFSFSSGYLLNLCVIRAPHITTTELDNKIGMLLIIVCIILSLGLCSFLTQAFVKAL